MKPPLLQRMLRRLGYAPVQRNGGYMGAFQGRLTSDWITAASGPNAELFASIATLRNRARDLEKNNPLVRRYLHLVTENVIGPDGIVLQADTGSDGNNRRIELAYWDWARPVNYSVDGRLGAAAFQQAVMRGVARDGEAFVRKVRTGPHDFALQLIDPALVDEAFNRAPGDGQAAVKLGVEVDQWDRPLAYHTFTAHRQDGTGNPRVVRVRIPADEMLHLFVARRPGQVRGESWLAPVMLALRHLDGYTEAELVAARTAAAKMGFILTKGEEGAGVDPDDFTRREMEAAPGVIDSLDPGQDFKTWDPSHPSQNFALFVTQVGKFVASGLNVSFAALTSDLREVNFSSARIGLLQERDAWRTLQQWFIDAFCDPVFLAWREVAWRKGRLPLRMTPDQYAHRWQPRGWEYTNPREEMVADLMAIHGGLKSPKQVVASKGGDYEEVLTDIAEWGKLAASKGVNLFVPNSLVDPDANDANGSADPNADAGNGGAEGGGRADPRLALVRSAGEAVVRLRGAGA